MATLAGAPPATASALALAMLGLQFCIGAVNDLYDEDLDAVTKPEKPIPAGHVGRRAALTVAIASGGGGLWLAAIHGLPVLLMAVVMLGAGLAYDAFLKRGPWSWAAYAVALPVLPLFAWWGASGMPPPRYELVLPVAALAGPALQLANGLVDVDRDRGAGVVGLAGRLGRSRALGLATMLQGAIHGLAWLSLAGGSVLSPVSLVLLALSGLLAAIGLALSASRDEGRRERGWQVQATALGLLAVGWLSAVDRPS